MLKERQKSIKAKSERGKETKVESQMEEQRDRKQTKGDSDTGRKRGKKWTEN